MISPLRSPSPPSMISPLSSPISPAQDQSGSSKNAVNGFDIETELPATDSILNHENLPPLLSTILSPEHSYIFESVSITKGDITNSFVCSAVFLPNVNSQTGATQWIQDFYDRTKTTYRTSRGTKTSGKRLLYKTMRHCQHKRKHSNKARNLTTKRLRDKKKQNALHL